MNIEYLWLAGILGFALRWLIKHRERVVLGGTMSIKERKLARVDRAIAFVGALVAYMLCYPQMVKMIDADVGEMALLLAASVPYNADSLIPKLMEQGRERVRGIFDGSR